MPRKEVENLRSRWHQALGRTTAWSGPEGKVRGSLLEDQEMEEVRK